MQVYYDKDANLEIIKEKKVVIVGYGSQGHAHANNLKDSGGNVTVALRKDSASWAKAEAAGLNVQEVAEAVKDADLVMILMPDELQSATYKSEIETSVIATKAKGLKCPTCWKIKEVACERDNCSINLE